MRSPKIENLLNLVLETPPLEREKSLNLNVGYEEASQSWEVIVKYNGSLERLEQSGIVVEELILGYAILTVPEALLDSLVALEEIEYVEKPKRLFFEVTEAKNVSCIPQVTLRPPYLSGSGCRGTCYCNIKLVRISSLLSSRRKIRIYSKYDTVKEIIEIVKGDTLERAGIREICSMARHHVMDKVLAVNMERFGRKTENVLWLEGILKKKYAGLDTPQGNPLAGYRKMIQVFDHRYMK